MSKEPNRLKKCVRVMTMPGWVAVRIQDVKLDVKYDYTPVNFEFVLKDLTENLDGMTELKDMIRWAFRTSPVYRSRRTNIRRCVFASVIDGQ